MSFSKGTSHAISLELEGLQGNKYGSLKSKSQDHTQIPGNGRKAENDDCFILQRRHEISETLFEDDENTLIESSRDFEEDTVDCSHEQNIIFSSSSISFESSSSQDMFLNCKPNKRDVISSSYDKDVCNDFLNLSSHSIEDRIHSTPLEIQNENIQDEDSITADVFLEEEDFFAETSFSSFGGFSNVSNFDFCIHAVDCEKTMEA